jgi:hypothetical protein
MLLYYLTQPHSLEELHMTEPNIGGLAPNEGRRPGEPIRLADFDDNGAALRRLRDQLQGQVDATFDLELFILWMSLKLLCNKGDLSQVELNDNLDRLNSDWQLGIQPEEIGRLSLVIYNKIDGMSRQQAGPSDS